MNSNNGSREYNILPLVKDQEEQWTEQFGLTDGQFSSAQKSYDRTMGIVGDGLTACQSYLEQAKADRESYYQDLAANPEKYASQQSQEPAEMVETLPVETTLDAAA